MAGRDTGLSIRFDNCVGFEIFWIGSWISRKSLRFKFLGGGIRLSGVDPQRSHHQVRSRT